MDENELRSQLVATEIQLEDIHEWESNKCIQKTPTEITAMKAMRKDLEATQADVAGKIAALGRYALNNLDAVDSLVVEQVALQSFKYHGAEDSGLAGSSPEPVSALADDEDDLYSADDVYPLNKSRDGNGVTIANSHNNTLDSLPIDDPHQLMKTNQHKGRAFWSLSSKFRPYEINKDKNRMEKPELHAQSPAKPSSAATERALAVANNVKWDGEEDLIDLESHGSESPIVSDPPNISDSPSASDIIEQQEEVPIPDTTNEANNTDKPKCSSYERIYGLTTCPCSHRYCSSCLTRRIEQSLSDDSLFPPKCCGGLVPIDVNSHTFTLELLQKFIDKKLEISDAYPGFQSHRNLDSFPTSTTEERRELSCQYGIFIGDWRDTATRPYVYPPEMSVESAEEAPIRETCQHTQWKYRSGAGRCDRCGHQMRHFLNTCEACEIKACNNCRYTYFEKTTLRDRESAV
ncbi:hypothetical protein FZEAL_1812 [Fusarium zealandicum]|uniref:RING-type domain-containing protein n=1 Tax=Fusarium zealandicum TaxID=1053134 RepID=A0A8H4USG2_9HYPO|nr:hypothetical protein FZEAL_1812 [Fusarium zealandicum]